MKLATGGKWGGEEGKSVLLEFSPLHSRGNTPRISLRDVWELFVGTVFLCLAENGDRRTPVIFIFPLPSQSIRRVLVIRIYYKTRSTYDGYIVSVLSANTLEHMLPSRAALVHAARVYIRVYTGLEIIKFLKQILLW